MIINNKILLIILIILTIAITVTIYFLSVKTCKPDCKNKNCGDDDCGGSCGSCNNTQTCQNNTCIDKVCIPDCKNKYCGDNGCGGSCGSCNNTQTCQNNTCIDKVCIPDCKNKYCGDNGCGGSCGSCNNTQTCQNNTCIDKVCIPDCKNKECGDNDGCEGKCNDNCDCPTSNDLKYQDPSTMKIINNTSEPYLHIFFQVSSDKKGNKYYWTKNCGDGELYDAVDWSKLAKGKIGYAWDPLGAKLSQEGIIPKGGVLTVNIPDTNGTAFVVQAIKMTNGAIQMILWNGKMVLLLIEKDQQSKK